MPRSAPRWGLLLLSTAAAGCRPAPIPPLHPAAASHPPGGQQPAFVDIAARTGIRYLANQVTRRPRDILQTNGSGCAFLDYDGDGDLDTFLAGRPVCALYRNDGQRFTDVTSRAGLQKRGYWIGVGAADFDNDGDPDLCVTGYRDGALYRNDSGRFREVTAASGVRFPGWGQSAAFGDVDSDGRLDLYIGAFARFGPDSPRHCRRGGVPVVCGPEQYPPELGRLFLNRGSGRFQEITRAAGLTTAHGRCWGAMFQDFDEDGRQDLYLGNDMVAGDLFQNRTRAPGAPRFQNVGIASGTAFDASGSRQGAMAVDWADYDNDGRSDLVVTTFSAQSTSLYHNDGGGTFSETSYATGLAQPTLPYVGFGAKFLDYDNDGWRDFLVTNGHVEDNVEQVRSVERYRQPLQLLRNERGRFRDVSTSLLRGLPEIVGRGAAFGDFDNDGRTDALVLDLEGPALLLRNQAAGGHWLGLKLQGTRSNRDGIGARVTVHAAGHAQRLECQTSGSVLSSNDPRVLVGLGKAARVQRVTVKWPSGRASTLTDLPADRYVTVREP